MKFQIGPNSYFYLTLINVGCVLTLCYIFGGRSAKVSETEAQAKLVQPKVGAVPIATKPEEPPRNATASALRSMAALRNGGRSGSDALREEMMLFYNREIDSSYIGEAKDWIRKAAAQDPELAFGFLKAHSAIPNSAYLAERFGAAVDTVTAFDFLSRPEAQELTAREREVIRQSSYTKQGTANLPEAYRHMVADTRLSDTDRAACLGYIAVKLPHEQSSLDMIINLPDQNMTGNALSTAMSYWSGEQPVEAAQWLTQHLGGPNPSSEELLTSALVKKWAKKDLASAADWVNSLPDGVSKETGTIYVAQATVPIDPVAALKWVERIQNPHWHQTLTEQAQRILDRAAQNQSPPQR